MALDVTDSCSNDSLSNHITATIPNPIDAYPPNPPSPSSLPLQSLHRPRLYPIFNPPRIKLQWLAKAKAAAMAQFDDEMCAALFDNNDLPLGNNIKASAAQFTSLCNNESFPAVSNIPDNSIHTTRNIMT